VKKLTVTSNSDNELDRLLASLDRKTKMQIFQHAANNLKRFVRLSAIEKRRKARKLRRYMRRRHLHRKYPRAAFDRLPMFSF